MLLKPIIDKPIYWKSIFKKLDAFMCDLFFSYPFEVFDIKIENQSSYIVSALRGGKVEYKDGYFFIKDKINSKTALEFEKMGAKFLKNKKAYKINAQKIPANIMQEISQIKIDNDIKTQEIEKYYEELERNTERIGLTLSFDDEVKNIEISLFNQLKNSLSAVNIIPFEYTDRMRDELSQNYTNNLKLYIRKFALKEIPILRNGIEDIVSKGYRAEDVKKFLIKRYGITVRKAEFLAKQETSLFVSEYRKQRFKENGITSYVWSSMEDDRVRPLHVKLNGTIQQWDNPPISEADGSALNPGEPFGCRCIAIPYIPDNELFPQDINLTKEQEKAIKEKRG